MIKMARVTRSGDTSRAVVRMKPPELGEVRIELTVREGVVHTKLEVADPTVRALMDSHLAELRSSLADDGLEIGSFQVSVRDGGEGGQQRLAADRAASGYGAENGSERDEESLSEVTNSREDHDGQIDLMA
jgi:flagellar hook-length control protein FliK